MIGTKEMKEIYFLIYKYLFNKKNKSINIIFAFAFDNTWAIFVQSMNAIPIELYGLHSVKDVKVLIYLGLGRLRLLVD